ncbi:dihydrodipicolinate synthase family protein [Actinomyces haliotis]|uniref:dihydrodipicolinate synthase family protein n=1 Tax=Actinomyces haliotis TaxID=1280843 RepID=UPI00188FB530|nr:dihydrodipicolinate synthase family protein [Actinomyces haliotis]
MMARVPSSERNRHVLHPDRSVRLPLTPLHDDTLDEEAFATLIDRLAASGVDSIGALGSTGCYPCLSPSERDRAVAITVAHAGGLPVLVGVGALRESDVVARARAAARAGAAAVLLPALAYHELTDDEVVGLVERVAARADLPVVVYDNPGTTHQVMGLPLYERLAGVDGVVALKLPTLPHGPEAARAAAQALRSVVPEGTSLGVGGDGADGPGALLAGLDAWCSPPDRRAARAPPPRDPRG